MSDNPYTSPKGAAVSPFSKTQSELQFDDVAPLCDVSGWLKFLGILNIVVGVIYCITIIGAIIGWLPLWIGITLNKAGGALREGLDQKNSQQIYEGMRSTALAVKIIGVIAAVYLALIGLYILFIIAALVLGAGAAVMSS